MNYSSGKLVETLLMSSSSKVGVSCSGYMPSSFQCVLVTDSWDFMVHSWLWCLQHKAIDTVLAEVKGWRAKWSVEKSSDLRCCFTGRDIFAVFSCASFHTCHTSFQLCFWTETSGYARRWICQILCRKPDNKASSFTLLILESARPPVSVISFFVKMLACLGRHQRSGSFVL